MLFNRYLLKSALVGSLGGFLFGFDTAVISGTTRALTTQFALSPVQLGITVSSALWGTVLGCVLAGFLGQLMGGRDALRIMAGLYLISALGCAVATNWTALLVFRCVGGLGIGGSSVLASVIKLAGVGRDLPADLTRSGRGHAGARRRRTRLWQQAQSGRKGTDGSGRSGGRNQRRQHAE